MDLGGSGNAILTFREVAGEDGVLQWVAVAEECSVDLPEPLAEVNRSRYRFRCSNLRSRPSTPSTPSTLPPRTSEATICQVLRNAAAMTYETYIRGWHERIAQNDARRRHREAEARRMLPKLVTHLVDGYGVGRILLFGSLADGHFDIDSDIDLAVEGLDGAALFRAGAELEEIAQHFRVDLIPMEQAYPELLRHVEKHGRQLHGQ